MPTVDAECTLYVHATLSGVVRRASRTSGLRGRFNLVGPRVLPDIFPQGSSLQTPKGEQTILRGTIGNNQNPGSQNTLTLDWVKHGQPFARGRCGDPPMMTLDWARHGVPFATTDDLYVESQKVTLRVLATLNTTYAILTPPAAIIVEGGEVTLNVRATFAGNYLVANNLTLYVQATQPTMPTPVIRVVAPCEVPAGRPEVSSNLPYDIWQENPNAEFWWSIIYACSRYDNTLQVAADGYYWSLSKALSTTGSYLWNYTTGNTAVANLSSVPPYGTGRWFFHVCAATDAGLGPVATYIVKYNRRPYLPANFLMMINGLDSLYACPHVAYDPPTPHVLSWTPFSDVDPADVLNYDVEIGNRFDFSVDPDTGASPVEVVMTNLPTPSGVLNETLVPGRHFWRIRATDANEYSDWSPIASFMVNQPPEKPWDLEVRSVAAAFSPMYVHASGSVNLGVLP